MTLLVNSFVVLVPPTSRVSTLPSTYTFLIASAIRSPNLGSPMLLSMFTPENNSAEGFTMSFPAIAWPEFLVLDVRVRYYPCSKRAYSEPRDAPAITPGPPTRPAAIPVTIDP